MEWRVYVDISDFKVNSANAVGSTTFCGMEGLAISDFNVKGANAVGNPICCGKDSLDIYDTH